jgi:cytochrome c oxidase assembly protein subunit 15
MVGGIFYEHGHRMIATFVGILTAILAILLWKFERRKWVRNLGLVALLAVILQGVLGGLTVIFLLPTWISVSHATLAQLFFSLTVFLSLVTSKWWIETHPVEEESGSGTKRIAAGTVLAVLMQLILGALMRHTGSGLAIPDFPLAYGELWPSVDPVSLAAMNEVRAGMDLLPVEGFQVAVHLLHRLWAFVVTLMIFLLVRQAFRYHGNHPRLREFALILAELTVFQILLGALSIWTLKNAAVATAHVATGALILGGSVLYASASFRLLKSKAPEHEA